MILPSPETPYRSPQSLRTASIVSVGSYAPSRILTNAELEKLVDTSDEWIRSRTGIRERRIAAADEFTSDMGARAAESALASGKIDPKAVDLIIVATCTPDTIFPSTACHIQHKIGATQAAAFDLQAACSGFLYGLVTAKQFVAAGLYETVLVIGAEKLSSIVNWQDRNTCVLFGDGAGAAVIQHRPSSAGIIANDMGADGAQTEILSLPAGGCRLPITPAVLEERQNFLQMSGKEVYRYAVSAMNRSAELCLKRAGRSASEVKWIIPHQANYRIIEAVADRLEISLDRFIINLDRFGNTSAACMPMALHEAVADGRVQRGDLLLFVAFGGGLTWASAVVEW